MRNICNLRQFAREFTKAGCNKRLPTFAKTAQNEYPNNVHVYNARFVSLIKKLQIPFVLYDKKNSNNFLSLALQTGLYMDIDDDYQNSILNAWKHWNFKVDSIEIRDLNNPLKIIKLIENPKF
tara:strand:+ start:604 stop:972 length:369 start_codon:yes stop_codon:yes gene_type:complete